MVTVTISNDFLYNLANSSGVVGQQPYKKITTLDTIATWQLVETLNDLKEFTFTTRTDEHEKTNILMERNISVPLLTSFDGIIVEKKPLKDKVTFKAVENAFHFTRGKFKCHDKARIKYTDNDWYDKLWGFRRNIKILGKKFKDLSTGSDLINFPLLFHTVDTELKAHARSDGFDIVFVKTENDGSTTKLHHEIESYTPSTGELWAWVEYPEIRSGQDEEFQMYFGNENALDQQTVEGTWDDYLDGFALVHHSNSDSIDSTSNNNDGTDTSITYVSGKIANAAQYDSVDSKIDCGSDASIDDLFNGGNSGWVSTWINPSSDGESNMGMITQKSNGTTTGWRFCVTDEVSGFVKLQFDQFFTSSNGIWKTTNADIPLNKFTRLDIVYDDTSASNDPIIYVNGSPFSVANGLLTETQTPSGTSQTDVSELFIIGNTPSQSNTFDGKIEEIRCLDAPPNNISELIKIEYANENDPDTYYIIGQVENFIQQADIIAENIIASANTDMPILNTTPVRNLISKWDFNGDVLDNKTTNNGTWTGTELYTGGVFPSDKSAKLDGSSRISTADTAFSFDRTNAFSFQIKVKTLETSEQIILSKRVDLTSGNSGYAFYMTAAGLPVLEFSNGTNEYIVTGVTAINDGEWHNLSCSFAGDSEQSSMRIYHNGILDAVGTSTTITGSMTSATDLTFGAGSAGATAFTGNLDDPRFYLRELTGKEMDRLSKMTQSDLDIIQTKVQWSLGDGHVTIIKNLISLWKFNQTLTDSKTSNDAIVVGTEQYEDGKYNTKGFDYDGSTYTTLGHTSFDFERNDTFSFGFWLSGNTNGSLEEIITKHDGTTGYRIFFNASDELVIELDDGTLSHLWTYTTNLRDGTFHHIGITNDDSDTAAGLKLYIDGIIATTTDTGTYPTATIKNTFVLRAGADSSATNNFTGIIDDLRIYSETLTVVEIKRINEQTDSGIDRIRDDNISTRLLEIDFTHKNHLVSLRKIAKELGVHIYFNSRDYTVFIKNKGKTIENIFDKIKITNPSFNLNKVGNVINIIGSEVDGVQKEKTFTSTTGLKYNYEKTFANKQINTDDTLNLIGEEVLSSIKDLTPDLTIQTTPDQFNKYDLTVGDKLKINELSQDLQGTFTIIKIVSTQSNVSLSLSASTNTTVQTTGKDMSTIISDLVSSIQDLNITPER